MHIAQPSVGSDQVELLMEMGIYIYRGPFKLQLCRREAKPSTVDGILASHPKAPSLMPGISIFSVKVCRKWPNEAK